MNMYDSIKNFAKQLEYQPKIENAGKLKKTDHFVILGMGGSHLAADLILALTPKIALKIHSDYGLPHFAKDSRGESPPLIIASSYSGNTEEVLDGLQQAIKEKISVGAIAVGGKLLEIAKAKSLPYIQLPSTGIQPRSATGFSLMALLKLLGENKLLLEAGKLKKTLKPTELEPAGKALAEKLYGKVPIIYSSTRNLPIAYNWKIKFNETGKIPAFYNVFPESNHNEMTGFDAVEKSKSLQANFLAIFLCDDQDHPRIQKRMAVVKKLYMDRGLMVEEIPMNGSSRFERIFNSTLLADWFAYYTSQLYGADPNQVPMVEELKKLIA